VSGVGGLRGGGRTAAMIGLVAVAGVIAGVTAGGCGLVADREDRAAGAAEEFLALVERGDTAGACDRLTPAAREEAADEQQAPCAEALEGLDLPAAGRPTRTDVYGGHARVVFGDRAVFLVEADTDDGSGWWVTAAGCAPRGERPYRCELKGG
jgi:hypothetical protein